MLQPPLLGQSLYSRQARRQSGFARGCQRIRWCAQTNKLSEAAVGDTGPHRACAIDHSSTGVESCIRIASRQEIPAGGTCSGTSICRHAGNGSQVASQKARRRGQYLARLSGIDVNPQGESCGRLKIVWSEDRAGAVNSRDACRPRAERCAVDLALR